MNKRLLKKQNKIKLNKRYCKSMIANTESSLSEFLNISIPKENSTVPKKKTSTCFIISWQFDSKNS